MIVRIRKLQVSGYGQLYKVYSSISDACSQGKRYCYINFYLTDRVKELLINDGFRIQVESYDMCTTILSGGVGSVLFRSF